MSYAVVIEKADKNYSAYAPDLPGCAPTGATAEKAESEIRKAIRFHLDGLKEDRPTPADMVDGGRVSAAIAHFKRRSNRGRRDRCRPRRCYP